MASETTSGTWASSSGSEATLATTTAIGTFVFMCDLNAVANGDEVVIKVYTQSSVGATSRVAYSAYYAHVQAAPNKYSIPVPSLVGCTIKMQQLAGTNNRSINWVLINI